MAAEQWVKEQGYTILSDGMEKLPFWENGVAFFIIQGPNQERIEFCERKRQYFEFGFDFAEEHRRAVEEIIGNWGRNWDCLR